MKTKTAPAKKVPMEPRVISPQTTYSESALALLEQATGRRFPRSAAPAVKTQVAAVDAE